MLWIIISIIGFLLSALGILAIIGLYYRFKTVLCKSQKKLHGKTAIVTGGSAGMGFEIAKDFARRGAKVIIACPFQEEGENARDQIVEETQNKKIKFKLLNLASFSSVREFAQDILNSEERLDILVNNAGVLLPNTITADGFNFIMQVNYLGLFLLTVLLLPLLKKSGTAEEKSRILNTSSMLHSMGGVNYSTMTTKNAKAYPDSKLCVTMFTRELAKRLKDSYVVINSVDPAIAATGVANGFGWIFGCCKSIYVQVYPTPWHGAQTAIHVALDEEAGKATGEYFYRCSKYRANQKVYDNKVSQDLWEETMKYVKLSENELNMI